MPTTSVPKMIGTTTDLIIRRKVVESGLSRDRDVRGEPAEQDAGAHPDEDPPGEREPRQAAEHQRPTSASALASMPASRERVGGGELGDAVHFELPRDRAEIDPELGQGLELRRRRGHPLVDADRRQTVVTVRREGLGWQRVHRPRGHQRLDVVHVGVARILGAGGGPERPLRPGAARRRAVPPRRVEGPLERS